MKTANQAAKATLSTTRHNPARGIVRPKEPCAVWWWDAKTTTAPTPAGALRRLRFSTRCLRAPSWLAGVDPHAYVLEATRRAIANPGAVTLPHELS